MVETTSTEPPHDNRPGIQQFSLGPLAGEVSATVEAWREGDNVGRLWRRDPSLWSGKDEATWLGWLDAIAAARTLLPTLTRIADDARAAGFAHVVVLGMGGSSLAPDVLRRTFGHLPGRPRLEILDSTVPAQVLALEKRIDLSETLFIVASKSGGTKEPNALYAYFRGRIGGKDAGQHFIAITDPGTKLETLALADGFRHVVHGIPAVGGRFSALTAFGLVPAALMGVDVAALLDRAAVMARACAAEVAPADNPGVLLGIALAVAARAGRDKLTLTASARLTALGGWLEQLVAESTGKLGHGIVPVDGEELGPPGVYDNDRIFVHTALADDQGDEPALNALVAAGHPVIRIRVADPLDLGQEWFRWEIATAAAGAVFGINPFDQPDVEAAKIATRRLADEYEQTGAVADSYPGSHAPGLTGFAPPELAELAMQLSEEVLEELDAEIFRETAEGVRRKGPRPISGDAIDTLLEVHLGRLVPGDYFAINAFLDMNEANDRELQALRHAVRDDKRVATTLGYGPRFLHSTGQLHKGGPPTGLYLILTADDPTDVEIPGERLTFSPLKQAQAVGDFTVLGDRGRRALQIHLDADSTAAVTRGLADLGARVRRILGRKA